MLNIIFSESAQMKHVNRAVVRAMCCGTDISIVERGGAFDAYTFPPPPSPKRELSPFMLDCSPVLFPAFHYCSLKSGRT